MLKSTWMHNKQRCVLSVFSVYIILLFICLLHIKQQCVYLLHKETDKMECFVHVISNDYILCHIVCCIYDFILITIVIVSLFDVCLKCVLGLCRHFGSYFRTFFVIFRPPLRPKRMWPTWSFTIIRRAPFVCICSIHYTVYYCLYLSEIECRFSSHASNFDEHRRCELKCDSIWGFAAACGGFLKILDPLLGSALMPLVCLSSFAHNSDV